MQLLIVLSITAALLAGGISYAMLSTATQSLHTHQAIGSHAGAIEGRVLDANGQPVPEAKIFILKSDFTTGKIPTASTDKEGVFSVKGLAPGVYTISVSKEEDGYANTDLPFYSVGLMTAPQVSVNERQTTTEVVVQLGPKAAKLVGRVVNAVTNKLIESQDVQITLRRIDNPEYSYTTGPDVNGNFTILVPPVPFTIEVSAPGYEKRHLGSLHLRQEQIERLGITLRPAK